MSTVTIIYNAGHIISTQQMLNLAYRMFNETVGQLVVHLQRDAGHTVVHIILIRHATGGPISESINIEEKST